MFCAIELGDTGALAGLWADDIRFWRVAGGRERDKRRALTVIEWFLGTTVERRYEVLDRRTFDCGFVQQHIVHATIANGSPLSFRACLIAHAGPAGLVTRIDEYLDPADLKPLTSDT